MEKLLLYCTKSKPYLCYDDIQEKWTICNKLEQCDHVYFNGEIVAECECDLVEKMGLDSGKGLIFENGFNKESYLFLEEMASYVGDNYFYALHLKNVKAFDKPLSFKTDCIYKKRSGNELVQKAPQNMMVVYDRFGNRYLLLSIHPEPLSQILKGEKTIEVRRKILKELKELIK